MQRPVGNESVVMVRRADDHRIEVFVVEAVAPVGVGLRFGKLLKRKFHVGPIDIAQGDHTMLLEPKIVSLGPTVGTDERDVELVVRRLPGAQDTAWKDGQPSGGEC